MNLQYSIVSNYRMEFWLEPSTQPLRLRRFSFWYNIKRNAHWILTRNGSFYYKPPDTSFSSGVLNPLDSAQDCLIKSIWVSFLNSSETNDFPNLIQRGQMANCCCLKYLNVVTVITSRIPKMCAILQLVSAPLNSIKNIEALSVKGFN